MTAANKTSSLIEKLGYRSPNELEAIALNKAIKSSEKPNLGSQRANQIALLAQTIQKTLSESLNQFHQKPDCHEAAIGILENHPNPSITVADVMENTRLYFETERIREQLLKGIGSALLSSGLTLRMLIDKLLNENKLNPINYKKLANRAFPIINKLANLPLKYLNPFLRFLTNRFIGIPFVHIKDSLQINQFKEEHFDFAKTIDIKTSTENQFIEKIQKYIEMPDPNEERPIAYGCPAKYAHLNLNEDGQSKTYNFVEAIYKLAVNKVGLVLFGKPIYMGEAKSKRKISDEIIDKLGFRRANDNELKAFTTRVKEVKKALETSNSISTTGKEDRAFNMAVAVALMSTHYSAAINKLFNQEINCSNHSVQNCLSDLYTEIQQNLKAEFNQSIESLDIKHNGENHKDILETKINQGLSTALHMSTGILKMITNHLHKSNNMNEDLFDAYVDSGLNIIQEFASVPQFGVLEPLEYFVRFGNLQFFNPLAPVRPYYNQALNTNLFQFEEDDFSIQDDFITKFEQAYKQFRESETWIQESLSTLQQIPCFGCPAKFATMDIPDPEFPEQTMNVNIIEALYRLIAKNLKKVLFPKTT